MLLFHRDPCDLLFFFFSDPLGNLVFVYKTLPGVLITMCVLPFPSSSSLPKGEHSLNLDGSVAPGPAVSGEHCLGMVLIKVLQELTFPNLVNI